MLIYDKVLNSKCIKESPNKDRIIPPVKKTSYKFYYDTQLNHYFPINDKKFEKKKKVEKEKKSFELIKVNNKNDKQITENKSKTNWRILRIIKQAHSGWIKSVVVDPITNKWFLTGSSDTKIRIWGLATLELKATLTGHILGVRSLIISRRHPYLFSGSEDKTIKCWDLEKTNLESGCQIRNYYGSLGGVYALDLHPEIDLLVSGGRDSVIRVWDIRTRSNVMVLVGHQNTINSIKTQSSDPQIISSSMDSTIRLWDLRNQKTITTLTHHLKSIKGLVMSSKEMTMCSGDSNGSIKQWLLPQGVLLNEFDSNEDDKIINTLSLNETNENLFVGYNSGRMAIYNYTSGKNMQKTNLNLDSNESSIFASTFDYLGLRLITCGEDKDIKIWGNDPE